MMWQLPASKLPVGAQDLTETWSRISRQHMSAGSGCGCGFGGLILQAADFELDIIEFVIDDAKTQGRVNLPPFIDAWSKRGPDRYSVISLLKALGATDNELSAEDRAFALARLATTLDAIENAHNKGRFSCD
jgi:hypothetical protein